MQAFFGGNVLLAMMLFNWHSPTPLPVEGIATHYAAGLMEDVAVYRLNVGDVVYWGEKRLDCSRTVAMVRKGDLGRWVWIEMGDQVVGPYLVVDVGRFQDFPAHLERGLVVEFSEAEWLRLGLPARPVRVRVLGQKPVVRQEETK